MNKIFLSITILLVNFLNIDAKTINVKTIAELQKAINTATSGDIIVLADNTYKDAGLIKISASGITVKAATVGGVILTGNSSIRITGSKNTLTGFQFKDIASGGKREDLEDGSEKGLKVVEIQGNYNIVTQCNFFNCSSRNYVHFEEGSNHNELSYCNLEAKPAVMNGGACVQITTSATVVNHTKIHHCTFMNFPGDGGDFGNEPIRIGLGVEQNNISGAVVEYCYFENLGLGDSETISIKSTNNVIRYNTFNNNPLAQVVFRTGNRNAAYGNFFINSGGIRIKEGGNHTVYNNYFEGATQSSSLELMNFKLNQKTLVGNPLDSIYVYHNTFYNAGVIEMGGNNAKGKQGKSNPPKHVQFANNLIFKEKGTVIENLNNDVTYTNNFYFGGAALGYVAKATEFANVDPLMAKNKNGYFSLSEKSPAINKAMGAYPSLFVNPVVDIDPNILLDIKGQARPADRTQKDMGCEEFSSDKTENINHPLKRSEVGPLFLANNKPTTAINAVPKVQAEVPKVKNESEPKVKKQKKVKDGNAPTDKDADAPKVAIDPTLTDTSSFENAYFKILKNGLSDANVDGARVIVALSNVKIKSDKGNPKIARGAIEVYKKGETFKIKAGEYFEVLVKNNHPALKKTGKWFEPEKNTVVYDDKEFRVFEERLEAGATRAKHSHAERAVVRLNEVQLTDPTVTETPAAGVGVQVPNTARFAEPVTHVTKNLGKIPLFNIVIEFKPAR